MFEFIERMKRNEKVALCNAAANRIEVLKLTPTNPGWSYERSDIFASSSSGCRTPHIGTRDHNGTRGP